MMNTKISLLLIGLCLGAQSLFAQLAFTGEVRPRAEYRDGFKTLNTSELDPAFFVEQRTRLGISYKNENLKFKISIQDVRFWGGASQVYKADNSLLNVNEAWGQYTFANNSSFKIGRQELNYDNARFLGNLAWAQQSRSHDLFKYEYNGTEGFNVHVGAAFNQEFVNANVEPARLSSTFYSGVNNYKTMQFLWLNKTYEDGKFSFLALSNGMQAADSTTNFSFTTGGYWNQKFGAIQLTSEAYYQFGDDPTGTSLSAYLLALEVGTKLGKHGLSVGVDHLSGTKAGATKNNSFTPLYGTNHKFYGFMDYFYVGNGHSNVGLTDLFLKANLKVGDRSNLLVHLHEFMSPVDITGTDGTKASSSLAQEIDLVYNLQLNKEVNFKFGFSALQGQDTIEMIKSGDSNKLNYWGWTMITFKPTFLVSAL